MFESVTFDPETERKVAAIADAYSVVQKMMTEIFSPSREVALAITRLEESRMWLTQALYSEVEEGRQSKEGQQ